MYPSAFKVNLRVLLIVGITCLPGLLSAATEPQYEKYSDRPDILSSNLEVENQKGRSPAPKSELKIEGMEPELWDALKGAHLEAVAEILEMYPDHQIYFLARDSEYLYDTAKLMTQDQPKLAKRIHLLNVSRANMGDPHLGEYLDQEGINKKTLEAGPVLFVDTGFEGSIPKKISELFPEKLKRRLQTHLLCSSNPSFPSTRTFLSRVNPAASLTKPGEMRGTIVSYEQLPRFTGRSTHFTKINNRWEAVSSVGVTTDGAVSPEIALDTMKALKAYVESKEARQIFEKRTQAWRELRKAIDKGDEKQVTLQLDHLMGFEPPLGEAMVRDFLEIIRRNFPPAYIHIANYLHPALQEPPKAQGAGSFPFGNKAVLMKKHPEWQNALEDSKNAIPHFIQKRDFHTLRAISDVLDDHDFERLLLENLGDVNPSKDSTLQQGITSTLNVLLFKGKHRQIAEHFFSRPHSSSWREGLKKLIEKGDQKTLVELSRSVFSRPHSKDWKQEVKLLIEKGDPSTLRSLAQNAFSQPHSSEWGEELTAMIAKGDAATHSALAIAAFSKPHSSHWGDQLALIIKRGDLATLRLLAPHAFSNPKSSAGKGELLLMIKRGDPLTLQLIAAHTFSRPHSSGWKEEIKLLIKKGDPPTLRALATAFSKPHSKVWTEELKLLIAKRDQEVYQILVRSAFSKPHSQAWGEELKLLIKNGNQRIHRELARDVFSQPHSLNWKEEFLLLLEQLKDPSYLTQSVFMRDLKDKGDPRWGVYSHALTIPDLRARKKYLEQQKRISLSTPVVQSARSCEAVSAGNQPLSSHGKSLANDLKTCFSAIANSKQPLIQSDVDLRTASVNDQWRIFKLCKKTEEIQILRAKTVKQRNWQTIPNPSDELQGEFAQLYGATEVGLKRLIHQCSELSRLIEGPTILKFDNDYNGLQGL